MCREILSYEDEVTFLPVDKVIKIALTVLCLDWAGKVFDIEVNS